MVIMKKLKKYAVATTITRCDGNSTSVLTCLMVDLATSEDEVAGRHGRMCLEKHQGYSISAQVAMEVIDDK